MKTTETITADLRRLLDDSPLNCAQYEGFMVIVNTSEVTVWRDIRLLHRAPSVEAAALWLTDFC